MELQILEREFSILSAKGMASSGKEQTNKANAGELFFVAL